MHNRKPDSLHSREIGFRDGLVLAPLVLCLLGLALYPQLILKRTDGAVQRSVGAVIGPAPEVQLASSRAHKGQAQIGLNGVTITPPNSESGK
jgi:NADH:ubiquinone oxidoreductase subunit 4 (subunit M)